MDRHTFRVLEFDRLKEKLKEYTSSVLGREAVDEVLPLTSPHEVRLLQDEVTEMVKLIDSREPMPIDGLYDVRDPLKRSAVEGAILDAAELIVIGHTVTAVRRIRGYLSRVRPKAPHLAAYSYQLIPHQEIEDAIDRIFNEHGDMRDSATHDLSRIRKSVRQQRDFIIHRLERLMRRKYADYLQENYYTHREGRFVLPIHAHYQGKVNGIVHDRSATGTTVFIEPIELVQDGNRLKDLQREEEIECRRILRELTKVIADNREELAHNLNTFKLLDCILAKAQFSIEFRMQPPVILDSGPVKMHQVRHPLLMMHLGRDKVVPFTFDLSGGAKGVVITGPNTGGKTVVLKTVGLLQLMAQCGMHIPAGDNTEIPVFEYIGADIGDEQSLEQSLSTFSSHIRNIQEIMNRAGQNSLVLLDELGSGTDPLEGGPLAMSIYREFIEKGATAICTTHLHDLKLYAFQTPNVENGALEFDLEQLCPSYKFTLGLPGQSNAIQIAKHLGLSQHIVDRAQAGLEQKGGTPEELLKQLGEQLRDAQRQRQDAQDEAEWSKALREENEERLQKAKSEAKEIIRRSERKAQGLLDELERRLKQMERQQKEFEQEWEKKLQDMVADSKEDAPSGAIIQKLRNELQTVKRQRSSDPYEWMEKPVKRQPWEWSQIVPNCRLRVAGFSEMGTVLRADPARKMVDICINSLNIRVKAQQILAVYPPSNREEQLYNTNVSLDRPSDTAHEIDIHGMTVDEMIPVVEKYVDSAFRGGLPFVRIVHGHGTGRLRRAVRDFLGKNSIVHNFRNGMDYEGGNGVTVVHFRKMS